MNFWPRGIVITIVLFMLFIIVFVVFAFSQDVVLVSENYYQNEINYNEQYARLKNAQKYKKDISLTVLKDEILITYLDSIGLKSAKVHFYNPVSSKIDKKFEFTYDNSGRKHVSTRALSKGKWILKLISTLNNIELYHEISFQKE